MGRYKSSSIDMGSLTSGRVYKFEFVRDEPADDVVRVKASCGCMGVSVDRSTGKISGRIKPTSVPYHLRGRGYYTSTKYVTVMYADGEQEVLSVKMVVRD